MMAKHWSARALELDAPIELELPAAAVAIDLDVYAPQRAKPPSKRKPKPDAEERDALPADRNRIGWYRAPLTTSKTHIVGFAYCKSRNAAGYFVSFTIMWRGAAWTVPGTRSNFHGWKTKRAAMDYCLDRVRDARKPKRERRYVIREPQ